MAWRSLPPDGICVCIITTLLSGGATNTGVRNTFRSSMSGSTSTIQQVWVQLKLYCRGSLQSTCEPTAQKVNRCLNLARRSLPPDRTCVGNMTTILSKGLTARARASNTHTHKSTIHLDQACWAAHPPYKKSDYNCNLLGTCSIYLSTPSVTNMDLKSIKHIPGT